MHEAGYKCANPRCLYPLTLDIHHLYYVSKGGSNEPDNLLPLCPTCHTEHHNGKIPTESLRAWKMVLISLNEAFDRRSISLLLTVADHEYIEEITGDGIVEYAPLAASGLIVLKPRTWKGFDGSQRTYYVARITDKGKVFVEGWKKGDQSAAIPATPPEGTAP